jgi:hypothetical protein
VNGKITYPKDPAPETWPASFDLHGMLSTVSGLDLINTNYILYLSLIIVFALILFSFAKALEKHGYRLAGYSAILFLSLFFTNLLDNFHHYSRTALGFTFLLFFFFAFICFKGRRGYLLQLMIAVAVLTTHPFQSLAMISFATSYFVLAPRIKRTSFVVFLTSAFVGWFLFNGSLTFQNTIDRVKTFLSPEYVAPLAKTLATSEILPWWGVVFRDFLKYTLFALLIVASFAFIVILYKIFLKRENDEMAITLASLLPMSLVILFSLLLLPDWGIPRFTSFAAFPAAFASFMLLDKLVAKKVAKISLRMPKLGKKALVSFLLLNIVILSAAVMVLRFERNYYYGELDHPSELSTLSFFFKYDHNSTVNLVSWRTAVHSAYFNYNASHGTLRLWYLDLNAIGRNSTQLLLSQGNLINKSDAIIRGMRDEFDFNGVEFPKSLLQTMDNEMILPKFNRIYSSDYYAVYSRSIGNTQ